ncbi:MAG TPA: 2-oxoacid:acceptor oxidoreductase subunit alpha, partial [Leptolinea sp.]
EYGKYSEDEATWEHSQKRLEKKFQTAIQYVPKPVIQNEHGADFGIIGFGSTDPAILEARDMLGGIGKPSNYCRIRAIPFTDEIKTFVEQNSRIYVVEINRDGQMCQLLQMTFPECAGRFIKICHSDGLPLSARWISESIQSTMEK